MHRTLSAILQILFFGEAPNIPRTLARVKEESFAFLIARLFFLAMASKMVTELEALAKEAQKARNHPI